MLIKVDRGNERSESRRTTEVDVARLALKIAALPRLKLRGLMTVSADRATPRGHGSSELAALTSHGSHAEGVELDTLSMGMSADFEAAIAAGSNCVRIGTAIFGGRSHSRQAASVVLSSRQSIE